jgi:MIT domain of nuclear receptor-binding factor 2
MENSLLNKAHFWERKADNYLRKKNFDDSIDAHQKAIQLISEIKSNNSKATESLHLQRDHHLRQIELITLKKHHYEKYKVAVKHLQSDKLTNMTLLAGHTTDTVELQLQIYKTMEEADSLLEILNRRGDPNQEVEVTPTTTAIKKPKDDQTVIEELKTLNHQLQMLVFHVLQEADTLKERIKVLELGQGGVKKVEDAGSANNDDRPPIFYVSNENSSDALDEELPALDLPNFELPALSSQTLDESDEN